MSPELLDGLGHLAYASLLVGTALVGGGRPVGWTLRMAGSAVWVALGWQMGVSSIVVWSSVFALIDLWGLWLWTRPSDSRSEESSSQP